MTTTRDNAPALTADGFYLTQRLERRPTARPERGFDGHFNLAYMGSAEFETGAVQDSLRRIRAAGELTVRRVDLGGFLADDDRSVWLVAPAVQIDDAVDAFTSWVVADTRTLEATGFGWWLNGEDSYLAEKTDAWWALGADVAFSREEETARLLLEAFLPRGG